MAALTPGQRVGGYPLLREVATDLWAARAEDGTTVLVHVLPADDPTALDALEREATGLVGLRSPYVVPTLAAGRLGPDRRVWVATGPVPGGDLRRRLATHAEPPGSGLPVGAALEIVRQAAAGVAAAHERGVLHRCLGPSAVLVGDDGGVQVGGLGLAGADPSGSAGPQRTWDVYDYTAPERFAGVPASAAADVYSLGGLLWTALTGRPPYSAPTPYDVVRAHVDAPLPQVTAASPAAQRVNAILARTLAKRISARCSAAELVTALTEAQRMLEQAAEPTERVVAAGPSSADRSDRPAWETPSVEVEPAAEPHPQPPARRRPVRRLVVVAVGVVAAAVAAATGMWLALGRGGAPPAAVSRATCWDESRAASAAACPIPEGPDGFAHVFPSFDQADCKPAPLRVTGKTEVYLCSYRGYLVRYSRWRADADRVAYYDEVNPGADRGAWTEGGLRLGTRWTSFDHSTSEDKRFQWSATYADQPFSVSVEGVTDDDRATGLARVRAVPGDRVRVAR